jgi:hypothetical protein
MKDAIEFIRSDNPFRTLPEGFRDVGFNGGASSGSNLWLIALACALAAVLSQVFAVSYTPGGSL